MTYTAEQLREESGQRKAEGQHYLALIFSGYADALDENARLKSEMESLEQALTDPENQPSQFGTVTLEWHEAGLAKLRQHAEAMFNWITGNGEYCAIKECEACAIGRAYRADFPEEDA